MNFDGEELIKLKGCAFRTQITKRLCQNPDRERNTVTCARDERLGCGMFCRIPGVA
jgi:hypothetical protein